MNEVSYDIPLSNHLAVSQLPAAETLNHDTLFLVSEPNSSTRTGFITRNITYSRVRDVIDGDFSLTRLTQQFNELCAITHPIITGLDTSYVSCENIGNPYIISSLYQSDGNITSCLGYRLSTGMDMIFKSVEFGQISVGNLTAGNAGIADAYIGNLSVDNSTAGNLTVKKSATFENDVTFNRAITVNGKLLDAAYRIHEVEIIDQTRIGISSDTVNVLHLTENTTFDSGSNDIDIVLMGVSPDMALDCELLIHKSSGFILNQPNGTPEVKLHFRVDDGSGQYVSDVDIVTPNFMSCDEDGTITDDTDLEKLTDVEEASYLYLISQLSRSDTEVGNPKFYISRQYLNPIRK